MEFVEKLIFFPVPDRPALNNSLHMSHIRPQHIWKINFAAVNIGLYFMLCIMFFLMRTTLKKGDKTEGAKIPIRRCVLLMQSSPVTFIKIKSFCAG